MLILLYAYYYNMYRLHYILSSTLVILGFLLAQTTSAKIIIEVSHMHTIFTVVFFMCILIISLCARKNHQKVLPSLLIVFLPVALIFPLLVEIFDADIKQVVRGVSFLGVPLLILFAIQRLLPKESLEERVLQRTFPKDLTSRAIIIASVWFHFNKVTYK